MAFLILIFTGHIFLAFGAILLGFLLAGENERAKKEAGDKVLAKLNADMAESTASWARFHNKSQWPKEKGKK